MMMNARKLNGPGIEAGKLEAYNDACLECTPDELCAA